MAQNNNLADKNAVIKYIDPLIETAERRIRIIEYYRMKEYSSAQSNSTYWLLKNRHRDIGIHGAKIEELKRLKDEISFYGVNEAISKSELEDFSSCGLKECLSVLSVYNKELADAIADISMTIVIEDWNEFSISSDKNTEEIIKQDNETMNSITDIFLHKWACKRSLATVHRPVRLNGDSLGRCFASIFIEESKLFEKLPDSKNKRLLSRELPQYITSDWSLPFDRNLTPINNTHHAVMNKIKNSQDYQLTPWALFRSCSKQKPNNLREAFKLCYETLRYNRSRPDFQRKLVDIRGDRSKGADNSGDWYHLFGMAYTAISFDNTAKLLYWLAPDQEEEGLNLIFDNSDKDKTEISNDFIGLNSSVETKRFIREFIKNRKSPKSSDVCSMKILETIE